MTAIYGRLVDNLNLVTAFRRLLTKIASMLHMQLRVETNNIQDALINGDGAFELVASKDIPAGSEVCVTIHKLENTFRKIS